MARERHPKHFDGFSVVPPSHSEAQELADHAMQRAEPPLTNTSLQRPAFQAGWIAGREYEADLTAMLRSPKEPTPDLSDEGMKEACDRWSPRKDGASADLAHFISGERNGFFKGWQEAAAALSDVERLRVRLDGEKRMGDTLVEISEGQQANEDRLSAENEKLRKALRQISGECNGGSLLEADIITIARSALAPNPPEENPCNT